MDYVSINACLEDGTSIGAVATAIEAGGIFTWDRFGRFRLFDPASPETGRALDALASRLSYLESPDDDDDARDFDDPDSPLALHGWPRDQLPAFGPDADSPRKPPSASSQKKAENASLAIVGSLLLFIRGSGSIGKHQDFKSEAALIDWITQDVGDYSGLSKSNLEHKFAEAKRILAMR